MTSGAGEHPNLVVVITDQERAPMHWPAGFSDRHLRSRARLLRHGLSFEQATCNTAMCSPSRATLLTGLMPAQHAVTDTLTTDGPFSATETVLDPELPNLGSMLAAAGYDVQYRGKWHLSKSSTGGYDVSADEISAYGFEGWIAPDAGGDTETTNFGGGRADHDAAYIEQAVDFLRGRATAAPGRPFCLVVSLVNPHDVLAFPGQWREDYESDDLLGDVALPATVDEDLVGNLKPTAQTAMRAAIDHAVGALETDDERRQYVNFYANLTARIDRQLTPILDCFYDADGTPTPLGEQTIVVRVSDHGELGMSHGGLRQKAFNVYEESLRVPLVFSNPVLFPTGRTCGHPASLVDVVPTLATLLGVAPPADLIGADLTPVLLDPTAPPPQDAVLFTFDDMHAGTGRVREVVPNAPGRIRCIREERFKYARYFDSEGRHPTEHEMYDLQDDPNELENLAHPDHSRYDEPGVAEQRERLAAKLAGVEQRMLRPVPA